jgi:hypothetical protein
MTLDLTILLFLAEGFASASTVSSVSLVSVTSLDSAANDFLETFLFIFFSAEGSFSRSLVAVFLIVA